jgi:hypothetical protein
MIERVDLISAKAFKRGLVAVAAVACLIAASPAAFAGDAAGDIADKFARDADSAATKARTQASTDKKDAARLRAVEDQRKADELEMLATARREADDRKRAEALAEKSGTPWRVQVDVTDLEQQRKLELERVATKLRLAREAREAKVIAEAKRAAETAKVAAGTAPALPVPGLPVPGTRAMERAPFWTAEVNKEPAVKSELDTSTRSALGGGGMQKFVPDTKVTVLMVLAPGNKGIRRFEKTADPVLCTDDGCYISQGANAPARQKAAHKTLGIGNTFGRRAGDCNHSLGCVFRGVEVGRSGNYLQPVDLKMMIHDQRARLPLTADATCRVASGTLLCGKPLVSDDYMLWVVPESIAAEAGADALSRAVVGGLAAPRAAAGVGVAGR